MKRFCPCTEYHKPPRKGTGSGFFYAESKEEVQKWATRTGYVAVTVVTELLLFLIWLWR